MSYLFLYGAGGWTQRWQVPEGHDERVKAEISRVGHDGTGHLAVIDPHTSSEVTLVVAWQFVAAAAVVDGDAAPEGVSTTGQYA